MAGNNDNCSLLTGQALEICESEGNKDDPCRYLTQPVRKLCEEDHGLPSSGGTGGGNSLTDGAADNVQKTAESIIKKINALIAPKDAWAPKSADSALYEPFLWLGQHLAVACARWAPPPAGPWQPSPAWRRCRGR
jgi:hypothetical protein